MKPAKELKNSTKKAPVTKAAPPLKGLSAALEPPKKPAAKAASETKQPVVSPKPMVAPAAPAKASAPVVPAKPAAPVAKSVPTPAPTPAPAKPAPARPAPKQTTIEAKVDVGFGNAVYLRGNGSGLSWNQGTPLTCVDGKTWRWTGPGTEKLTFKFLLNDSVWAQGEDLVANPGQNIEAAPVF